MMKNSYLLKNCTSLLFTAMMCLASTMLFAQDADYSNYLYNSRQLVAKGDCRGALNNYIVYVRLADQTDKDLENQIAQCFEDNAAKAVIPVKQQVVQPLYVKDYEVFRDGKKLDDIDVRRLFANTESFELYDKGMNLKRQSVIPPSILCPLGGSMIVLGAVIHAVQIEKANDVAVMINRLDHGDSFIDLDGYTYNPFYNSANSNTNKRNELLDAQVEFETKSRKGLWMAAGGGAVIAVGIIWNSVIKSYGRSKVRKSVDSYNGDMRSQTMLEIDYGLTGNGVYFTLSF